MSSFWQDIAFGWRQLKRAPVFLVVAVLTLAVGIGVNTIVLGWIQAMRQEPLPGVKDGGRLAVITELFPDHEGHGISFPDMRDLAAHRDVFAGIAAFQRWPLWIEDGNRRQWIWAQAVSGNLFQLLGVNAALGRTFDPVSASSPASPPEVVISHEFWRAFFGADRNALGRTIQLNRQHFTIIGVAAPAFRGTMSAYTFDLWLPAVFNGQLRMGQPPEDRGARYYYAIARLHEGVGFEQAAAVTETVSGQLAKTYPDTNQNRLMKLRPLLAAPYGGTVLLSLFNILLVVTALVLLLILANLASLLIAKATARRKELALRQALGANRFRIVRQLLTESLLLGILGGCAGLLLAAWGMNLLNSFVPPSIDPIALPGYRLNIHGFLYAFLLAILSSMLFGLSPALRLSQTNFQDALKAEGRTVGVERGRQRLRNTLIVAETALATFVLIGAGICLKGFQRAQIDIYSGFNPDGVLLVPMLFPCNDPGEEERRTFHRRLMDAVRSLPSVESASLCDWVPLFRGAGGARVEIPGYQPPPGEELSVSNAFVAPDYFKTMQARLAEGREFTEADDSRAPARVIINQTMARRFWPGQSPVGRHFSWNERRVEVIGVAKDFKYDQLNAPPVCFLFASYLQFAGGTPVLHVRSKADPARLSRQIDKLALSLNPNVVPYQSLTLAQSLSTATFLNRVAFIFLSVLGGFALLLASLGTYGVLACVVEQRTREIGVRIALGATPAGILRHVICQGLTLVTGGILLGLLLAFGSARLVFQGLYGVRPVDPTVYALVAVFFVMVGVLACYLPARKATLVDPMDALRSE